MDAGKKNDKKPNPRETANFLSALTFSWTIPIFWTGFQRDLEVSDLSETLRTHQSARMGDKLAVEWEKELSKVAKKGKGTPSLLLALIKCFGLEVMMYGFVLAFVEIGIRLQQPRMLGIFLRYFDDKIIGGIKEKEHNTSLQMNST